MALRDVLIAPRAADADGETAADGFATVPLHALGEGEAARGSRVRFRRRAQSVVGVVAPALVVLGAPRDVRAVGVAVGLVTARSHPAALVCVHVPGEEEPAAAGLRAPARAAAARLAGSLRARGLDADARGKAVLVEVADDPAAGAARALAAAGPLPTVLAVAARDPDLDVLLAAQDAILVALPPSADPALAELATTGARALTPSAASIALALDPLSRSLALTGLRAPSAVRAAVEELVG
jgi:hypothetical protein